MTSSSNTSLPQPEFVFVRGFHGPEGQIWYEPQVDGSGKRKEVLLSIPVDGTKTVAEYEQAYRRLLPSTV